MNIRRIYAIILRNLYVFRRSVDRLADAFYWITLDLILWGITGAYFQSFAPNAQAVIFMLISGVVLWNIVFRTQADINVSILEELWNKNLVNIFVTPLKLNEFLTSLVFLGIIKAVITLSFGTFMSWVLFRINLLNYSTHLIAFFFLLSMTGIWMGFLISSIILRYGTRIQTFGWTLVWVLSPFSAIYFPVASLPSWAQVISRLLPTSYVFEQARNLLNNGTVDYRYLAVSFSLNIFMLLISSFLIISSFRKVLQKGLVKVY